MSDQAESQSTARTSKPARSKAAVAAVVLVVVLALGLIGGLIARNSTDGCRWQIGPIKLVCTTGEPTSR